MSQTAMSCVERVYHGVIEDVINGVREHFIEEGVDEQVLTELKQAWEAKLARMNVLDHSDHTSTVNSNQQQNQQPQQQQQTQQQQPQQQQQSAPQQQQTAVGKLNNGAAPPAPTATTVNLVPVQITVPAQQAGGVPKTITIHVPSTALANGVAGQQLQAILSSPTAAHTFSLEASRAAEIIQRKLNVALEESGITLPAQLLQYNNISNNQVDGACDEPICPTPDKKFPKKKNTLSTTARSLRNQPSTSNADSQVSVDADKEVLDKIIYERLKATQVDGQYGTGDSSSEISDDDDDDEDDKDAETEKNSIDGDEDEEDAEGVEEEPLNSEDDVSDDDTSDMFDTENVVVCQYDKITRVRNKWKFTLKDGIMNLRGKDYVFQKATGDGEW
ncbi:transcription initiation factor IIA subunit 1 [Palaemon carinicauda]|uniref:transcription initiation factor IIA subunit 1 n=1 Tax=Palaemon carinicauda TaxID=392227 RepID=UPI0035B5D698